MLDSAMLYLGYQKTCQESGEVMQRDIKTKVHMSHIYLCKFFALCNSNQAL